MAKDDDGLAGFAANDEIVAHVIIYASSDVLTQYSDALLNPEGIAWLGRRLDQAKAALADPSMRVLNGDVVTS